MAAGARARGGRINRSFGRLVRVTEIQKVLPVLPWTEDHMYDADVLLDQAVQSALQHHGSEKNAASTLKGIKVLFERSERAITAVVGKVSKVPDYRRVPDEIMLQSVTVVSATGDTEAFVGSMSEFFLTVHIVEAKSAETCMLYKTESFRTLRGALDLRLRVPVASPKSAVLVFQLIGVSNSTARNTAGPSVGTQGALHVLGKAQLDVRKLAKGNGTKPRSVPLDGILQRCSLEVSGLTRTVDASELALACRGGYRAMLHRAALSSQEHEHAIQLLAARELATADGTEPPEDIPVTWSGKLHPTYRNVVEVVQAVLQLTNSEIALDTLAVLSRVQLEVAVQTSALATAAQLALKQTAATEHQGGADAAMLVDSLDLLVASCMGRITSPFNSFDPSTLGTEAAVIPEVKACLEVLQLAYSCDLWQDHTKQAKGSTVLSHAAPILLAAQLHLNDHAVGEEGGSFGDLKAALIDEYGQREYFAYKAEIESLVATVHHSSSQPKVKQKKSQIMLRLTELLRGEDATLAGVKKALAADFGAKSIAKYSDDICRAIMTEIRQRRRPKVKRGLLEKDVLTQLTNHVGQRYVLLVDRATPQSEFEGSDIVTLTKVLTVINLDLELVEGTFGPLYQRMSGLDVFEEVVQLYGTFLGSELEHLLHRWKPKNSGSELAGILFDLYFEVRNLVEGLKPKIRQASWERTSIFRYTELFEPFIIYWLRLSQLHVRHCISVSLKKDTLSPVKSDELYSISVRDVFKTLVESIEYFIDLNWADRHSAETKLLPPLLDMVTSSVRFYAEQVRELAIGKRSKLYQKSEVFFVNSELCCALNNIDEAEVRFEYVCKQLEESNIRPGTPLETKCVSLFAATKAALNIVRGDLMHFLAIGLQPRIASDIQYMMYAAYPFPYDIERYVDEALGPLLDDPDNTRSARSEPRSPTIFASLINMVGASSGDGVGGAAVRPPKPDGYLCQNLLTISQFVAKGQTMDDLIFCIWERTLHTMRRLLLMGPVEVPLELQEPEPLFSRAWIALPGPVQTRAQLPIDFQQVFGRMISAAETTFVLFFNDDGDGVAHDKLLDLARQVLSTTVQCCQLGTSQLVAHCLRQMSARHGKRVRQAETRARAGKRVSSIASPTPSDESVSEKPAGTQYVASSLCGVPWTALSRAPGDTPGVEGGSTSATDIRADHGTVTLRMQYDHATEALFMTVVGVQGVSTDASLYYKVRLLPRPADGGFKARSDRDSAKDALWMFKIPGLQSASALQLRVHESSAFSSQQDSTLGEVLLCTESLVFTTRVLELDFALEPPRLAGGPGCAIPLQVLRQRAQADPAAAAFASMYPAPTAPLFDFKLDFKPTMPSWTPFTQK